VDEGSFTRDMAQHGVVRRRAAPFGGVGFRVKKRRRMAPDDMQYTVTLTPIWCTAKER